MTHSWILWSHFISTAVSWSRKSLTIFLWLNVSQMKPGHVQRKFVTFSTLIKMEPICTQTCRCREETAAPTITTSSALPRRVLLSKISPEVWTICIRIHVTSAAISTLHQLLDLHRNSNIVSRRRGNKIPCNSRRIIGSFCDFSRSRNEFKMAPL